MTFYLVLLSKTHCRLLFKQF